MQHYHKIWGWLVADLAITMILTWNLRQLIVKYLAIARLSEHNILAENPETFLAGLRATAVPAWAWAVNIAALAVTLTLIILWLWPNFKYRRELALTNLSWLTFLMLYFIGLVVFILILAHGIL